MKPLIHYLKQAFLIRPAIPGLGEMPVNLVAVIVFAILGAANPGFWLLGLAMETVYLFALATNPRFQRLIDAMARSQSADATTSQQDALEAQLDSPARERLRQLESKCRAIMRIHDEAEERSILAENNQEALAKLQWLYLKLLLARKNLDSPESDSDMASIPYEIAVIERELSSGRASTPARKSRLATLEILKRRLEVFAHKEVAVQEIDSDLERIEAQIALELERANVSRHPKAISTNIDLTSQLLGGGFFGDAEETVANLDMAFGRKAATPSAGGTARTSGSS